MSPFLRTVKPIALWPRRMWCLLGITLLFILLIEGGLRIAFWIKDRIEDEPAVLDERADADGYGQWPWTEAYFREFHDSNSTRWHSYVYWRRNPYGGDHINVDEEGRRRTWNPPSTESAGEEKRIFVFGGSTVWGTGARDDHTIPSCLSRILNQGGYPARVTNFGESGYVNTQGMIAFLLQLQRNNIPSVAIFYDGVNDVFSALQNREAGIPQNEENRRRDFNTLKGGKPLWRNVLRLFNRTSLYRFAMGLSRRLSRDDNRTSESEVDALAEDLVHTYEQNLKMIKAAAEEWGVEVLFYWQPAVFLKRNLTLYEAKKRNESDLTGDLYLSACRRIASSTYLSGEARFHDLSRIFEDRKEPVFVDWWHLNEEGNEVIALRMAEDVKK